MGRFTNTNRMHITTQAHFSSLPSNSDDRHKTLRHSSLYPICALALTLRVTIFKHGMLPLRLLLIPANASPCSQQRRQLTVPRLYPSILPATHHSDGQTHLPAALHLQSELARLLVTPQSPDLPRQMPHPPRRSNQPHTEMARKHPKADSSIGMATVLG